MSDSTTVPTIAPETSVPTRMDLVHQWLIFLPSVIMDMASYNPSSGDHDDLGNKQLHSVAVSHALVWSWMVWLIMTAQAATASYISILIWLHGLAPWTYLYLQDILFLVEGIAQCVNWQLQQNYDHIRTSISAHGITNQCTFVVKPNTSSKYVECSGLPNGHQRDAAADRLQEQYLTERWWEPECYTILLPSTDTLYTITNRFKVIMSQGLL